MNKVLDQKSQKHRLILVLSLLAVYLIWGSTYLAIKFAIETLPSFIMAGMRFIIAGSILYAIARFSKGYKRPSLAEWRTSLIVGTLLLGIGNGAVVIAEHYISSSLAALMVATLPFWMVVFGWLFAGHGRPGFKVNLGLVVGFVGVALLVTGSGGGETSSSGNLFGIFCVVLATVGWAIGSLYGQKALSVKSPIQAAAMQMLTGGGVLFLASVLTGEIFSFDPSEVSSQSWMALGYLIVFGAIVAYTAYSWLMANSSPAVMSTYAYVNPVIAVILGWAFGGEILTVQMIVGAAIVVGSVALITTAKKSKPADVDEDVHRSQMPTGSSPKLAANNC